MWLATRMRGLVRLALLRAAVLVAAWMLAVPPAAAQFGIALPGLGTPKAPTPPASAPSRADLEAELAQARAQQLHLQQLADSGAPPPPLFEEQRNLVARWATLLTAQLHGGPAPEAAAGAGDAAALPAVSGPPYPLTEVDSLRDHHDELRTRQRGLALRLDGIESQLATGLAQRRRAEEALRLRQDRLAQARDAQAQERLRAEAEVARLEVRIAAIELGRADGTRQALRTQRMALDEREATAAREIERVRLQQVLDATLLEQVAAAAQAARSGLDEQRRRLGAQIGRREAESADALPGSASTRELAALHGQMAALVELDQIEAGREEAWRLRRLALQAIGDVDARAEAQAVVGRAIEQIASRAQAIGERLQQARSSLRAERLRVEALEAAPPGAASTPAVTLALERRAIEAMQREADAFEGVQERLQRLQRLLARSRDDLVAAGVLQPAPLHERLWAAASEAAAALWRYELFSVSESSQIDGRTVSVDYGVTVGKSVGVVVLFLLGWLAASRLSRVFIAVLVRRLHLTPQLGRVLYRWLLALLLLAVLVLVLKLARIPLTAFAFLGGALAIGVGFGTQTIIKNLISGVIILFERKVRVGDIVTIDGVSGTVSSVDLRATTVRGFDGIEAIVPNSQLLENRVSNWSYGNPVIRRAFDIGLRYGNDARAAAAAVLECAGAHASVLADPPPEVLFADFGADAQVLRLQYWIRLGGPQGGPTVDSDLRHAISSAFAARGLVIAFPQRDVHVDVVSPIDVRVQRSA